MSEPSEYTLSVERWPLGDTEERAPMYCLYIDVQAAIGTPTPFGPGAAPHGPQTWLRIGDVWEQAGADYLKGMAATIARLEAEVVELRRQLEGAERQVVVWEERAALRQRRRQKAEAELTALDHELTAAPRGMTVMEALLHERENVWFKAEAERDAACERKRVLAGYTVHKYGCGPGTFADVEEERKARSGPQCTCGLAAALAAVKEETG